MPSEAAVEVRERDTGNLVLCGTPHECELLCLNGHVVGVATKNGRLKYLKLTVEPRVALRLLHRRLQATGRTVAEASQLISRLNVPGGGVIFSHILKRTATYEPSLRQGNHPTYATLREVLI